MKKIFVIAIDGPSGSGKSSLAKGIAKNLGIVYVDTGALYRTIGFFVKSRNVDPKDSEAVCALLPQITLELKFEDGVQNVILNGFAVGDSIRTPEMSMYASAVSAHGAVRAFLLDTQRSIAKTTSVVMDGRDIGTVIFPNADVKIFLTASHEERARRRTQELAAKGVDITYEQVLAEMTERDRADSTRKEAPAIRADDAIVIDNSSFEPQDTLNAAMNILTSQGICRGLIDEIVLS